MDFDSSGTLFALDFGIRTARLLTIDPSNGRVTTVGTVDLPGDVGGSIVFDTAGTLIGSTSDASGSYLFDIDPANGDVSNIGLLIGGFKPQGMGLMVQPNAPPDCSAASASHGEIWPPDGKFVDVSVLGVTDPDGDPVAIRITGIAQDEPLEGLNDRNTCPDAMGVDTEIAVVRAERSGADPVSGDGRVYHVSFTAEDGQGGECSATTRVCVPRDQRPGHVCVDQGPLFDSTSCGQ
jgi:hypothetical protein